MAYREETKRPVDRELDALHDLLARARRVRRQAALPTLLIAAATASIGVSAHVLGYWSVFGVDEDGRYLLGAVTVFAAASLCALPVLLPGAAVYLVLRARTRNTWRIVHARAGVDEQWLAENVKRYG